MALFQKKENPISAPALLLRFSSASRFCRRRLGQYRLLSLHSDQHATIRKMRDPHIIRAGGLERFQGCFLFPPRRQWIVPQTNDVSIRKHEQRSKTSKKQKLIFSWHSRRCSYSRLP
jgi:hypothetical protein